MAAKTNAHTWYTPAAINYFTQARWNVTNRQIKKKGDKGRERVGIRDIHNRIG